MFDEKTLDERYDGDGAMLALFHEWLALFRRYHDTAALYDEDDEKALDRAFEIEHEMYAMPARGAAGLAIKAYLFAYNVRFDELTNKDSSPGLGTIAPDSYPDPRDIVGSLGSLAEAMARFVPELAQLVAGVVKPRLV